MKLPELKRRAKQYVEHEGRMVVKSVKFVERFQLMGREDIVLLVTTSDAETPEWWVVGGGTPMNLYSKKVYKTADEAFSLHTGIMLRMMARDYEASESAPEDVGYDLFISHASEDKDSLVRPLAKELTSLGLRVWYDEFELRVGDSLRKSIDQGLVCSAFGVVVLSRAFFAKNWPDYELNGLVAREIQGRKVILPVWHGVSAQDVLKYSPALADKYAVDSSKRTIGEIARELRRVVAGA